MSDSASSLIGGIIKMKCPNCRKGQIFVNKSVLPLSKCLKMEDNCEVCGQRMLYERNNGGGINYALNVIIFFLNILWYWPIFGISYKDNSIIYYLFTSIAVIILIQPWLMRWSKVIYLYIYIAYQKGPRFQ
ncbi:MAG: DUF983 domain-containing protein [Taibaiella sp.]|nr:DUF983 domain-containing protein [Taibaiella sp.]